jgi:uncharacterized protein (UPF0332 family)
MLDALLSSRLELSKRFLQDAKVCLENKGFRSCVSRSYYAVYHACVALLEFFNFKPGNFRGRNRLPAKRWEHKIIIVNFHIEFVQRRKLFDWSMGMQLRSLYDTRIRGDYKPNLVVTEQLARERFILAEKIFQQIVEVIQK